MRWPADEILLKNPCVGFSRRTHGQKRFPRGIERQSAFCACLWEDQGVGKATRRVVFRTIQRRASFQPV